MKALRIISKALTIFLTIVFGVVLVGSEILVINSSEVSKFLGVETQKIVNDETAETTDTQYYKSDYSSVAEVIQNGEEVVEKVMAEGAVLLKNAEMSDGSNALPLSSGDKVSLFSTSSVDLVYTGGGSSQNVGSTSVVTLKEAFEADDVGLEVNDTLWNWYNNNLSTYGRPASASVNVAYDINDASWTVLPDAKTDKAEAAIFVLARKGNEHTDLYMNTGSSTDTTNGNSLELSPKEISVLQGLKAQKDAGRINKIIVIMNSANQVQTDFVDDESYGIDALLMVGNVGSTGPNAIADILVGNVNPSGRLSDTFWKEHRFNPVYANYDVFYFENGNSTYPYVVYQEGIYNGYRYTETRYEDIVMDTENVGNFSYYQAVSYPFGYGLSYTTFEYSDFTLTEPAFGSDTYTLSVKVTNTGSVAGKEVVQIYLQKPYTDYDIQHGIEKASVELVGFSKTDTLDPGESQVITIEVEGDYLASYDSYYAKTYIVDEGTYYFTAGKDAHDAINNILAKKGYTTADGMTEEGNADLVSSVEKSFDKTTYSVSTKAKEAGISDETYEITNQFDNADINLYDGAGNNTVTYITRSNWSGTCKLGLDENNKSLGNQVKLTWTSQIAEEAEETNLTLERDNIEYPTYGSTATSYNLIDLRAYEDGTPIEYNNEMWEDLLDQLTWDETVYILSLGQRTTAGLTSINKPQTIDHNGAVGVNQTFDSSGSLNRGYAVTTDDPDKNSYPVIYPSSGVVASTFNKELMEEYGEQWGEDCLWAGYSGIYGPACNTHRSAYGGRAFEYFSEDSYLGGISTANVCMGIQEKGVYVYLKHAILNDQENQRKKITTWANEQTIREIYLKQFQIAIEDGGVECVMTGYNKIGAIWTGNQGFCNNVLRNEFGMTGFAVTDYLDDDEYVRMPTAVLMGNDLPDRDYSSFNVFDDYSEGYGELAWAMRESVHRILYTVVQSNAMNGISSSTKVIQVTPVWLSWVNTIEIVVGVLFGLSVVFLAVVLWVSKFGKTNPFKRRKDNINLSEDTVNKSDG